MFAQWEIPYRSLVVQREASAPIEITAEIIDSGSVVLKLFKDILRLLQIFPAFLNLLIDKLPLHPVADIGLRKEKKRSAGQWKDRDDEHPGQLGRGIHFAVEQIDDHGKGEQPHEIDQDRQFVREIYISADQNHNL